MTDRKASSFRDPWKQTLSRRLPPIWQNLGTSISITNQSAGDQLLSELGKGAIQGVSQYISRKMREEKVHLKSGYTLMLYQNDNQ